MPKGQDFDGKVTDLIRVEDDTGQVDKHPRLRKHVAVVHSYAPITLLQRKLLNVLLYRAIMTPGPSAMACELDRDGQGQRAEVGGWYELQISEIRRMLGIQSRNTEWMIEALQALQTAVIEYNLLGDQTPEDRGTQEADESGKKQGVTRKRRKNAGGVESVARTVWESCVLIPSISLMDDGTVRYQINQALRSYLLSPEIYASLDMREQARLKTKAGHALYELICRFQNIGSSGFLELDQWRKLLGVAGRYPRWSVLRKQVLEPAMIDVNENTGFSVRAEVRKRGRAVVSMRVVFHKKTAPAVVDLDGVQSKEIITLRKKLASAGVRGSMVERLPLEYSQEVIEKALNELVGLNANGAVESAGGWLVRRIQNLGKEVTEPCDHVTAEDKDEEIIEKSGNESLMDLTEEQRERFWEAFKKTLTPVEFKWLELHGPDHKALQAQFEVFVKEMSVRNSRRKGGSR
ncbi:MAG: RepB family plasmid replication initiator protein [Thioalkalivibrio sp.]